MNREEMVCSFEQSEKLLSLLQLGLESNLYWYPVVVEDGVMNQLLDNNTYFNIPILTDRLYPAYCSAELDRMLHSVGFGVYLTDAMKYDPEDPNNANGYTYDLVCLDPDSGWDLGLSFLFHNGARAKAQGLIWLLDETIVEAKDILL